MALAPQDVLNRWGSNNHFGDCAIHSQPIFSSEGFRQHVQVLHSFV